jgi:hypothetical protein
VWQQAGPLNLHLPPALQKMTSVDLHRRSLSPLAEWYIFAGSRGDIGCASLVSDNSSRRTSLCRLLTAEAWRLPCTLCSVTSRKDYRCIETYRAASLPVPSNLHSAGLGDEPGRSINFSKCRSRPISACILTAFLYLRVRCQTFFSKSAHLACSLSSTLSTVCPNRTRINAGVEVHSQDAVWDPGRQRAGASPWNV